MCMTPGCGKISHPMAQSYSPKGVNASNPFAVRQSKAIKPMNHNSASAGFYGTPSVKASFKIGKY